jgi:hypothetical protein
MPRQPEPPLGRVPVAALLAALAALVYARATAQLFWAPEAAEHTASRVIADAVSRLMVASSAAE